MAGLRSTQVLAVFSLLLAVIAQLEASKIAYKKALFGKTSYIKEKRFRLRTTSSPTIATTETDWPAPVEFIINSTPRALTELGSSIRSTTGSTVSTDSLELDSTTSSSSSSSNSSSISTTSTESTLDNTLPTPPTPTPAVAAATPVPCTCGVFLSSQIQNGLPETPLIHNEMDRMFACNAIGRKQCQTKCLEMIVQHLPNSANIVCATLGHNCHKERAYLFIKNCQNHWVNTNLQAGREYCCKEGVPYRCPLIG